MPTPQCKKLLIVCGSLGHGPTVGTEKEQTTNQNTSHYHYRRHYSASSCRYTVLRPSKQSWPGHSFPHVKAKPVTSIPHTWAVGTCTHNVQDRQLTCPHVSILLCRPHCTYNMYIPFMLFIRSTTSSPGRLLHLPSSATQHRNIDPHNDAQHEVLPETLQAVYWPGV